MLRRNSGFAGQIPPGEILPDYLFEMGVAYRLLRGE